MKRRDFLIGLGLGALFAPALVRALAQPEFFFFGKSTANPKRLFAAGPPAAVLIHCLAPDKLLGWPWPVATELLPEPSAALPMLGKLAGRGSTIGLEQLYALKPDLIVDAGNVDPSYLSQAQKTSPCAGR